LKFFGPDTKKLPDDREREIERLYEGPAVAGSPGTTENAEREIERYLERFQTDLHGVKVVVDCAHGAACPVAPPLWQRLGATIIPINDAPDGLRINVRCGSTHPDVVRKAVLDHGADVGFAHDGDADRVIAVDETGRLVDGDGILGLCAAHLAGRGGLNGAVVVATVMSNLGLEVALARSGIRLERTRVGDRYVLERMRELGASLGGEQSGHVVFLDHATTGDGLATAVQVVNVMMETGKRLSELAAPIERYPQVLKNVRVTSREAVGSNAAVQAAVGEAERRLGSRGRVLVRPSGTEPLVRVMVEAEDAGEAELLADHLVDVIGRAIGAPVS